MNSIRKFAYVVLLALTTLNFAPSLASAQEPARGRFTLTHDVRWENAKVPAGEYRFSYDPGNGSSVLSLSKLSGTPAGFMLKVPITDEAKPTDLSRLILESSAGGSYVSALQLPEFGMTLRFSVPSHPTQKQIAKATTAAALGQ